MNSADRIINESIAKCKDLKKRLEEMKGRFINPDANTLKFTTPEDRVRIIYNINEHIKIINSDIIRFKCNTNRNYLYSKKILLSLPRHLN